ncbi:MAG TPA: 2-hydroxyacid dehydrogenase [Acidimicrobiales bacterium]|jgi:phosphoglycerate dehydrogenase-like enzyme
MAPESDRLVVSVADSVVAEMLGSLEGADVIVWDMTGPPPISEIDVLIPPYLGRTGWTAQLPRVTARLIQSSMVGYDGIAELLPAGTVFANAATVHETSTAELALGLVLASQRGIPEYVRDAERGEWKPTWRDSLADRHVLLVGYGGVGKAIAARLAPFEVELTRVARHARHDESGEIFGMGNLETRLAGAEIVIVAVPLNASTTHLVNDRFLSSMREGSLLVNVSRGPVADTEAILTHARTGRLRFALDVTDPEPLPQGHPLFALDNVLITPHVGGRTSAATPRLVQLVKEQVARMRNGDEPLNVVIRT